MALLINLMCLVLRDCRDLYRVGCIRAINVDDMILSYEQTAIYVSINHIERVLII